jgi:hypothetical protein
MPNIITIMFESNNIPEDQKCAMRTVSHQCCHLLYTTKRTLVLPPGRGWQDGLDLMLRLPKLVDLEVSSREVRYLP